MGFLKKCIVSFSAIFLIFFGGAGVKSDSIFLQAIAFIALLIALVILYVFIKMAWRAMGCLPALLIIFALTIFVMYGIGAFSGGFDKITENIQDFMGQNSKTAEETVESSEENINDKTPTKTAKQEDRIVNLINDDEHKILTENLKDKLLFKHKNNNKKEEVFNPMKAPAVSGVVRVLSGDTLVMNGAVINLFGVAAPKIKQTCAARDGRGYRCGQQSARWLSGWLADNVVDCHLLQEKSQGVFVGICALGPYDIGAAIINSGWAVADIRYTDVYQPYQNQALENHRGMWDGKFYMPWDWQKIQNRKANIKIIQKKPSITRAHSMFF